MKIFIIVILAVIVFTCLAYVLDWMKDEPEPARRNPRQDGREQKPRREEIGQGKGQAPSMDEKKKDYSGMNPQERIVPGIIPEEKKPEPVKKKRPEPFRMNRKDRPSLKRKKPRQIVIERQQGQGMEL